MNKEDFRAALDAVLLDHLPKTAILRRYDVARGKELQEKFKSPESSSVLVANAFGFFLEQPDALTLPHPPLAPNDASSVLLEAEMRFPWSGGTHPWLDVVIETESTLIGIESKRYEPYRDKKRVDFSDAYDRAVWGDEMAPFERMRDELKAGRPFLFVGAAQLVKHAFGLRTQARKRSKKPVLCYLYAEPAAYPDGKSIARADIVAHRREIDAFATGIVGAEVEFYSLTYQALMNHWSGWSALREHSSAILRHFDI